MSRTSKKAATANETGTTAPNLTVSARNGRSVSKPDKDSKSERSFQATIERMQSAIASGKFEHSKVIQRGEDALKRANKVYADLLAQLAKNGKGEKPASEYNTLKTLFDRDLKHLTIESFVANAELQVSRLIKKSRAEKLTAQQQEIIVTFYDQQARAGFNVVREIRELLVARGAIKETPKPARVPANVDALNVTTDGITETL